MITQKIYSDILLKADTKKFNDTKKENNLNSIQTSFILGLGSSRSIDNYEQGIGLTDTVHTLFMLIFNKHDLYVLDSKSQYKIDTKNINSEFLPTNPLIINPPLPSEIKKLRKEAGLTQSEMAEILGLMGKQTIYKYEKCYKPPKSKVLSFSSYKFIITEQKFNLVKINKFKPPVKNLKSDATRPKSQLWTIFLLAINKHPYFLIKRK